MPTMREWWGLKERSPDMEGYERSWFVILKREEDIAEALSYLKGFSEEAVLSHSETIIEIWIKRKVPQDIQQPANCQTGF